MPEQNLSLQEQLLLLHLNDETGKLGGYYVYGLNAATLAELLLNSRIVLDEDKVKVKNTTPTGDEVVDTALTRLASSQRTYHVARWVRCLYRRVSTATDVLIARLIRRGILTEQEGRILWIFPTTTYPTANPAPELQLRQRVRDAVLTQKSVDERMTVLIAILHGCGAMGFVLNKAELRKFKNRIQHLYENNPIGYAVGKAAADNIAADAAAAASAAAIAAVSASSS
jgi:hypothetical protein